ncbi:hypothetical protein ACIQC9_04220 [Brevundimonas sp. NPDC092305]|uniref:hypothetical protein n=1 Tax=Brevundimonas sp. NPDC092305 TaxID=3363957 RepID=UPI0037F43C5F
MSRIAVLTLASLTLAACGERADTAAPTPAEKVSAAPVKSDAQAQAPIALTAGQLRQICRAGLANIHGQALSAMQIDGLEGQVVNASWPAPVDGGRRRAQCRVEGEVVTWKPSDAKNPEEDRWMNTAADPVTRFALDGDQVTITTTLPDGTTATEEYAVAAEQEAR